jgi:hypothetical protein
VAFENPQITTEADIPVQFFEVHEDGLKEEFEPGSMRATKRYRVAWNDRWKFFQAVVGRVVVTGGVGGKIARIVPLSYPDAPWLYARRISCSTLGASKPGTPQGQWDWATIDIGFEAVPWSWGSFDSQSGYNGNYRSESVEISGEMLQLNESALVFGNGLPITHNQGMVIPQCIITVTQEYCPYINYNLIFGLAGTVNSVPFYSAAPGTVMFMGCNSEAQYGLGDFLSSRLLTQKLTAKFAFRPVPWNMAMRPDGVWDVVKVKGTGKPLYPGNDLNMLFFDVDPLQDYIYFPLIISPF